MHLCPVTDMNILNADVDIFKQVTTSNGSSSEVKSAEGAPSDEAVKASSGR